MANAQIVNIPDSNFKAALVNNAAINTNGDAEIQVVEATAFTGQLYVFNMGIGDLTGIEAFTALTTLDCSFNQLASLDFSTNTALNRLDCYYNQLTSLDVSANTALNYLFCDNNQLASLDVSANTALYVLYCENNQLTSLDFSATTALTELYCDYNQLTSLDVSANTALIGFYCTNNQLTSLNVQNGNNVNFSDFNALNNPNLTCIQVDSVAFSNANWSAYKDSIASFSTNCVTSVSDISNLATIQIAPNPANDLVTVNSYNYIQKIELINMQGQIIEKVLVNYHSSLLDVSNISNGIYQLKFSSSNQSQIKRLVVAH